MIKTKIPTLIFVFFSSIVLNFEAYSENVEKDYIDKRIEENKRIRQDKVRLMIEQKINDFENKESFINLSLESKIRFYETLISRINSQKSETINAKRKDVYEIFYQISKKRLEFYNPSKIEGEDILLELLGSQ